MRPAPSDTLVKSMCSRTLHVAGQRKLVALLALGNRVRRRKHRFADSERAHRGTHNYVLDNRGRPESVTEMPEYEYVQCAEDLAAKLGDEQMVIAAGGNLLERASHPRGCGRKVAVHALMKLGIQLVDCRQVAFAHPSDLNSANPDRRLLARYGPISIARRHDAVILPHAAWLGILEVAS